MNNANLYRGYDQQGLDAQYNNRARGPEHVEMHTGWETEGEAVLAEFDTRLEGYYQRLKERPAYQEHVLTVTME